MPSSASVDERATIHSRQNETVEAPRRAAPVPVTVAVAVAVDIAQNRGMTFTLTPEGEPFVTDRHLATLSTIGPGGLIHAVAVGFTLVDGVVRIITRDGSQKVRNVERSGLATVAQVAGPQWISFAGHARVTRDPEEIAHAVALYAVRYREPRPNPERVAIELVPQRVLASAGLLRSSDA